ncbi:MAG: hypothetical protein IH987_19335 [Planctomycetes bacterium]|nr:hypothetical protein [Planctomycetota bacterium]
MKRKRRRFVTKRLNSWTVDGREEFSEFSVVGSFADNPEAFVSHAAMLKDFVELPAQAAVAVWHMGPPLVAGERLSSEASERAREIQAEIVGDIALSIPERNKMKNWIAKVDKQRRPRPPFQQYVIQPPMKWERSEKGRKLYQRFSCAGFVIECFVAAGINLIDSASLPAVDEQLLSAAYPVLVRIEQTTPEAQAKFGFKGRGDLGLVDEGPWPIVLAGYLFHSLQRASSENPRPAAHALLPCAS